MAHPCGGETAVSENWCLLKALAVTLGDSVGIACGGRFYSIVRWACDLAVFLTHSVMKHFVSSV